MEGSFLAFAAENCTMNIILCDEQPKEMGFEQIIHLFANLSNFTDSTQVNETLAQLTENAGEYKLLGWRFSIAIKLTCTTSLLRICNYLELLKSIYHPH